MGLKTTNIAIAFVFGLLLIPNLSNAQEGSDIPVKVETSEESAKDSIPVNGELTPVEMTSNSDALTTGGNVKMNLPQIPPVDQGIDKGVDKTSNGTIEKPKPQDSQSKLSFNFIYYLFYKFKLVDGTDG